MKNNHPNQDVTQVKEPTEEVLNSLYATIFLEHSVYVGNKQHFERNIEKALDCKDRSLFIKLTDDYKEFLSSYENGLTINEKGFEFLVFFGKQQKS
jgi:uncharacterized protein YpiB (UPF0302 family)